MINTFFNITGFSCLSLCGMQVNFDAFYFYLYESFLLNDEKNSIADELCFRVF